jgi:pimeloyl-ACP methyl ester carboxylesterase
MNTIVTHDWFASLLAALVLLAGIALWRYSGTKIRLFKRMVGGVLTLLGTILLFGAVTTRVMSARFVAANPPPGQLVDAGGFRMHLHCEGPRSAQTVLWLPGGYGQGLWLKPLHDRMKTTHRSCLIDRAGTGWSDAASTERKVQQQVVEMLRTLDGANETAPLILVGHSLGGLMAANIAALHPQRVAGLLALDPTPQSLLPEALEYWLGSAAPSLWQAIAVQFGVTHLVPSLNPVRTEAWRKNHEALRPVADTLAALEERPTALVAAGPAAYWTMAEAYGVVRLPGALGALPVLAIIQPPALDAERALIDARQWLRLETEFEVRNWRAMVEHSRREYPAYSSRGQLKYAPLGSTHNFPLEHPDFVLAELRQFMTDLTPRGVSK